MKQLFEVNGRFFKTDMIIPIELKNEVVRQISSKINQNDDTKSLKAMGQAFCGGPYTVGTSHPFSAVPSGGFAPYTYWWTIQPPTGAASNFNVGSFSYTFQLVGTYNVTLEVKDSCTPVPVTNISTCTIIVNAACTGFNVTMTVN